MILTKVGLIALVNAAAIHKRAEEISFMPLRSSDGHIPADAQQVFVENQPPQFEPVPTSNAAGGPPPIYQYIVGRDYPASTLRQFPANSREECANLCNAGCDFIVFGNGNCQIKYLNRPSFVGSIFKNQQNANFLFGELHNTPLPQVGVVDGNVQQCIDACNANANCHFASFYYGAVQNSQITGVRNCKMYQFPANADRTIGFRANPNPINVDPQQLGRFDVYGNTGIVALHATLMNNGKILFGARPEYNRGGPNTDTIARQEVPWGEISSLFDIASGTSVPVQIDDNLFCHTMFHLANGDIFTAGGDDYPNVGPATIGLANGLRKQRVYEQGTNRYVNYHDMQIARWYPTALRMPNGDIWVMGGASNGRAGAVAESSIEVFRQGRAPNPVYPLPVMQDNGMALYPIVRMIPGSGNVFVWVGQGWGIHDKNTMQEVQGNHRAVNNIYTNTFPAGSVVLALDPDQGYRADFLIFGGGTGYKNNYAEEVASDQVLRMTIR